MNHCNITQKYLTAKDLTMEFLVFNMPTFVSKRFPKIPTTMKKLQWTASNFHTIDWLMLKLTCNSESPQEYYSTQTFHWRNKNLWKQRELRKQIIQKENGQFWTQWQLYETMGENGLHKTNGNGEAWSY